MRYAELYPELFASLTAEQAVSVEQSLASAHLDDGQTAGHDAVADLVDLAAGRITQGEHLRRVIARAGSAR